MSNEIIANENNMGYKTFEEIKHVDEFGNEYWHARELSKALEYTDWRNFMKVINKARKACVQSKNILAKHLVEINRVLRVGNNAKMNVKDFKLSRYICYLIVQNADPSKEVVALGQTYFAIQTRKQELTEKEYDNLTEDEKRIYQRNLTRKGNYSLNQTAKKAGVKNFDKFHNYGYKGL